MPNWCENNLILGHKDEDRINIESGNAAIQLSGLLTDVEKFDKFGFLTGLPESMRAISTRPGVDTVYVSEDGGTTYHEVSEDD